MEALCYQPSFKQHQTSTNLSKPKFSPFTTFRCNLSDPSSKTLISNPEPLFNSVKAFAPATVSALGVEFLSYAVEGVGDLVTLKVNHNVKPGEIIISDIIGGGNSSQKLSKNPLCNSAGIAANAVMKKFNIQSVGLSLSLEKGLPVGSGLGSSAASAVAAAVAVNEIFGAPLSGSDLVPIVLESVSKVSRANNVTAALIGGFVLIRRYDPLDFIPIKFPSGKDLFFALVYPEFEALKKMRAELMLEITLSDLVGNGSQAGTLVASVFQGDVKALGKALSWDNIVEPWRASLIPSIASLIPSMDEVMKAAIEAGAYGCMISGAGPSVVAVTDDEERGREIGERMVKAFMKAKNLKATAIVKRLDCAGARVVCTDPPSFIYC